MSNQCHLSVVVPFFNESEAVDELLERLRDTLSVLDGESEIICIDDGSTDNTYDLLRQQQESHSGIRLINLRGNFGQTAALTAGFVHARGNIVIAMDGDLQHAPEDIPRFVAKIDEGFDVVSGCRQRRQDSLLLRRLPSLAANLLMRNVSGVQINDFGTTFKAYRRDVIQALSLYGDFHRFIPALASELKARMTEIPIDDRPRKGGQSKYNLDRTLTVFFDLLRIKFLLGYRYRPLQVFGSAGLLFGFFGGAILIYLLSSKIFYGTTILAVHGPLFLTGVLLVMLSMQLFSVGFLGEMIQRLHHDTKARIFDYIREKRGFDAAGPS